MPRPNLKKEGIHIALDTAGQTNQDYKELLEYVDLIIYDIKEIKYKVFYWYFINNKAPLKAAKLVPCGKSTIYRYIDEINEDRKSWEKVRKL